MWSASTACGRFGAIGLGVVLSLSLQAQSPRSLRFEVTVAPEERVLPGDGRLIVTAVPVDDRDAREPRLRIGRVGRWATSIAAVDVDADQMVSGQALLVDDTALAFPAPLLDLKAGRYSIQAVLDLSRDMQLTAAPGNLYSRPVVATLDPGRDVRIDLTLTERVPSDALPPESEFVRYVRLRSELLSDFHGRPIFLSAAVIVPFGFEDVANFGRRYPLRITVGGFGERFTAATRAMGEGSEFRAAWLASDTPRMLRVFLDGAGPYGDPYQVNSANNGPYGDAVTQELIPHIEDRFRGVGDPAGRVVDGGSTGGWVSLALQIFYPDFFGGAWSFCPDSVDFRAFQRVNIYSDANAYTEVTGDERPSRRGSDGGVRFTMRHELLMENVLGRGDSWTRSGQQWGAWNAVYGPRGEDGHPVPLWDTTSGAIDQAVTAHWEQYDLRLVLARNWPTLRPKIDGKLNLWVGEMDDYYLNEAVHLLDDFLRETDRSFKVRITYGGGQTHCWAPLTERELLNDTGRAMGATP